MTSASFVAPSPGRKPLRDPHARAHEPVLQASAKFEDLTLIIPTLNEEQAVPLLLDRVAAHYPGATVILADDDSSDATREVAGAFRGPIKVRVLHRTGAVKGLTASVVDGLKLVETRHFVVMDADLQHPPEAVLEVYRHASNGSDLAVGRRLNYEPLTTHRRLVSRGARALTRGYLRARGGPAVDDPMSGFFGGKTAFARGILDAHEDKFEKRGFKVLVDFLKFAPPGTKVHEVPYTFAKRVAGSSKLALHQVTYLLRQLGPLGRAAAFGLSPLAYATFWKFALVGLSGVAVNELVLYLSHGLLGQPLLVAGLLATEGAILWNFLGNDRWSFKERGRNVHWARRLARFNLHCGVGALANLGVLAALTAFAGVHYLAANLVGIAVAMAWNYGLSLAWTWRDERPDESPQ